MNFDTNELLALELLPQKSVPKLLWVKIWISKRLVKPNLGCEELEKDLTILNITKLHEQN